MEVENSTRNVAAAAIDKLRRLTLAGEMSYTEQAKVCGIGKQAIGHRYKTKDMKVSEFIKIAQELGESPSKIIEQAEISTAVSPESLSRSR
ncbi:hypothetical protein [Alloscardovia omnicolens]